MKTPISKDPQAQAETKHHYGSEEFDGDFVCLRWNGLEVPYRVRQKFYEYAAKGRFNVKPGKDITHYLWHSKERELPLAYRQGVAGFLKLPDCRDLVVRESPAANHFALNFIIYRGRVIELVSHDTIRRMSQGWLKRHLPEMSSDNPFNHTLREIYKYKHQMRIGSGLMRQEKCPKDRWKNTNEQKRRMQP